MISKVKQGTKRNMKWIGGIESLRIELKDRASDQAARWNRYCMSWLADLRKYDDDIVNVNVLNEVGGKEYEPVCQITISPISVNAFLSVFD